jgi:hypothetical protein
MTDASAVAVDVSREGVTCVRCGYDLRGLAGDGRCPECGLAVSRSTEAAGRELRHAPPHWLASLSWGARLVLAAPVLAFVYGTFLADYVPPVSLEIVFVAPAALSLVFAAGAWLLTRPQRRFTSSPPAARWALRGVSFVPFVQTVVSYAFAAGWIGGPRELRDGVLLGFVPLPALMFYHLRGLALRVLDPALVEHCTIVGVGGSLSLATAGHEMFNRIPIVVRLSSMVGVFLFLLWALFLVVRFTVFFERARRASVAVWGRDA